MKRYFLILLMLFLPFSVKAVECDYQDMARYQRLASNINFSYDFVEVNNSVTFNIIVSNMPDELYIVDEATGNVFSSRTVGATETVLTGYEPGRDYRFNVISYDEYCYEEIIVNKYVNLPSYNSYYTDPVCQGAEKYKLCQKWTKVDVSYEKFVENVNKYKETSSSDSEFIDVEEDYTNDFLNKIIVGFLDYYVIILLTIIVVCTLGIVILSKKDKFDLK